ncbi:MAG: OmpA family protein [Bacteroidaceae bacterium]|nr:OmpA family protein [Bacteroidaceae bacterium]
MLNLKTAITASLVALCGLNASAQTATENEEKELGYKPQPYYFVQVQAGASSQFSDPSLLKIVRPTFSVAVGGMFSPSFGARLHFNGYRSANGLKQSDVTANYAYNYINSNFDLMLNLSNLFTDKNYTKFNVFLIGGVGLNYAWNNSEFETLQNSTWANGYDLSNAWGDNQNTRSSLLSHNLRVGVLADYNISKHFSLGLEVDLNSLDDKFNSKYNNSDDWMMTAQISGTYKFGFKKASSKVKEQEDIRDPRGPIWRRPLREVFFYEISASNTHHEDALNNIILWLKHHEDKTVTVEGYADKNTGNPEINMQYSLERANKVADLLRSKGVKDSQINVKAYGDTVQPFSQNDKNRCVIVTCDL